jgi:hypothetical protein
MASEFDRARMRMHDRLLKDKELTKSTRVVGLEILRRTNRITGRCFVDEAGLAEYLGVGRRTVIRAVQALADRYFTIARIGRANRYTPIFAEQRQLPLDEQKNLSTGAGVQSRTGAKTDPRIGAKMAPIEREAIGAKNDRDRCQNGPKIGAKKCTLTPIEESPFKTPVQNKPSSGALSGRPDDYAIHLRAVPLLGDQGEAILEALCELPDEQPYLRFLDRVRNGTVSPHDIASVKLLVVDKVSTASKQGGVENSGVPPPAGGPAAGPADETAIMLAAVTFLSKQNVDRSSAINTAMRWVKHSGRKQEDLAALSALILEAAARGFAPNQADRFIQDQLKLRRQAASDQKPLALPPTMLKQTGTG